MNKKKYLLSELYGRIGQILQEHGDMEIGREKIYQVDSYIDNQSLNIVNLTRNVFQLRIIRNEKDEVIYKKFLINVLQTSD